VNKSDFIFLVFMARIQVSLFCRLKIYSLSCCSWN